MHGRKVLGVGILALWGVVVGLHVEREYFVPEAERLAQATGHLNPETHHYVLEGEDGRTVGTAVSRVDTLTDGLVLEDRMDADGAVPGVPGAVRSHGRVEVDRSLRLRNFSFEVDSDVLAVTSDGTVEGDSLLRVRGGMAGGEDEEAEMPLEEPPIFQSALPIRLAMAGELAEGVRREVPVLDPAQGEVRRTQVEVEERRRIALPDSAVQDPETGRWEPAPPDSVDVWRVQEQYGEFEVNTWVDQEGRIVRAETPFGFDMQRRPLELVQQATRDREDEGP